MDTYVTNVSQNFNIEIHHSPTANIADGGSDNNKLMHFRVWWYNGSSAFRPTGTVTIGGVGNISTYWLGGHLTLWVDTIHGMVTDIAAFMYSYFAIRIMVQVLQT